MGLDGLASQGLGASFARSSGISLRAAACYDILVESLEFCRREKGLRLYGWVIMAHHFHAVLDGPDLSEERGSALEFAHSVSSCFKF